MKRYIAKIGLAVVLVSLTACNDWLDVSPKTEIKAKDNFSSEQGFKDALTGCYLTMTSSSLYGKELTFGLLDVLAQYYTGITGDNHSYAHEVIYDYDASSSETRINAVWEDGYNLIANINELIAYVDKADTRMFTGRNYHLIRGEAYGLRAQMHFDLLRCFGKSYAAGPIEKAIPYITENSKKVTPLSTVEAVLAKILADLEIAESELQCDPVITGSVASPDDDVTYERDRTFKFNYYAVKMLQARVYLYMGNYEKAEAAARVVVNQESFTFTPESEISTTDVASKNYVFSQELVFALYNSDLQSLYTASFTPDNGLYMLEETYESLYETDVYGAFTDYRYVYQTELQSNVRLSTKLKQLTGGNASFLKRTPVMRLSEAYYIMAECAAHSTTRLGEAVGYLNTVRTHRGHTALLPETLSKEEIADEIYKEYAKEFTCEGQLWFYFKRLDYEMIPVLSSNNGAPVTTYVLPDYIFPLPDDEIEFGGRENE